MAKDFMDAGLEVGEELNINDAAQMRQWMQHWNVSEAELRMAVANVGTEISEIRIVLGR